MSRASLESVRFSSRLNRAGGTLACVVICAVYSAGAIWSGEPVRWPPTIDLELMVAYLACFLAFVRPEIIASPGHLVVRNPLRDIVVPWSDVAELQPGGTYLSVVTVSGQRFRALGQDNPNYQHWRGDRTHTEMTAGRLTEYREAQHDSTPAHAATDVRWFRFKAWEIAAISVFPALIVTAVVCNGVAN